MLKKMGLCTTILSTGVEEVRVLTSPSQDLATGQLLWLLGRLQLGEFLVFEETDLGVIAYGVGVEVEDSGSDELTRAMWEKKDHIPPFLSIEVEEGSMVRMVYTLSIQHHYTIGLEK